MSFCAGHDQAHFGYFARRRRLPAQTDKRQREQPARRNGSSVKTLHHAAIKKSVIDAITIGHGHHIRPILVG